MSSVVRGIKKAVTSISKAVEKVGKIVTDTAERLGKLVQNTFDAVEKAVKTVGEIAQPLLERGLIQAALQVALPGVGQLAIAAMSASLHTLARGGKPEDALKAAATVVVIDKVGVTVAKAAKDAGYSANQIAAAQSAATSAVATAAAGGNIEDILKAAAIGSIGGVAGTEVLNQTQNAQLATFTQSVVVSALRGQKIEDAILNGASAAAVGYLRELQKEQEEAQRRTVETKAAQARLQEKIATYEKWNDYYNDPNLPKDEKKAALDMVNWAKRQVEYEYNALVNRVDYLQSVYDKVNDLALKATEEITDMGDEYAQRAIDDLTEEQQMLADQIQEVAQRPFGGFDELQFAQADTGTVTDAFGISKADEFPKEDYPYVTRSGQFYIDKDNNIVDAQTKAIVGTTTDEQRIAASEDGLLAFRILTTGVAPQPELGEFPEGLPSDDVGGFGGLGFGTEDEIAPEVLPVTVEPEVLPVTVDLAPVQTPSIPSPVAPIAPALPPAAVDIGIILDQELADIEKELEQADEDAKKELQDSLVEQVRQDLDLGAGTLPDDIVQEIENIITEYETGAPPAVGGEGGEGAAGGGAAPEGEGAGAGAPGFGDVGAGEPAGEGEPPTQFPTDEEIMDLIGISPEPPPAEEEPLEGEMELGGGDGGPVEEEVTPTEEVPQGEVPTATAVQRIMPTTVTIRPTQEFAGRGQTPGFGTRVTGEALTGILGEKEPLFGGDDDEQRAVWNRRSLRLRRALGL